MKTYWQSPKRRKSYYPVTDNTKISDIYAIIFKLIYDSSVLLMNTGYGYEDFGGTGYAYSPFNGMFGGVRIKLRNDTILSSNSTTYNNAGWLLSSVDSYGLKTEYIYNVFGEVTQTRRQQIDGNWIASETVYDSQGRVIFTTDSHLENSTDPIYCTRSLYDSKGRNVGNIRYVNSEIEISVDGTSTIKSLGTEITRYEYGADGIRASAEHEIYIDGELQSKTRTEYLNDAKKLKRNRSFQVL